MYSWQPVKTVSVIIPTRNRRRRLERALRSVAAQTHAVHEVIVVDDGSTDGTFEWLKDANPMPGLLKVVHHTTPAGGSAARNAGIASALGEMIAFLDDDDEWMPGKLEKQLGVMNAGGRAVASCWYEVDTGFSRRLVTVPESPSIEQLLEGNVCGSASLCMVKATLAREVGGFDVRLPSGQDWDFWIRLRDRAEIAVAKEALVRYVAHDDEKITSNVGVAYRGTRAVFMKHRPRVQSTARRRLLGRLAYLRSLQPGSRSARLRSLARAVRWHGEGSRAFVISSLPRILVPESLLQRAVRRYVSWRTCLAGRGGARIA